jgi:hypothetical protein
MGMVFITMAMTLLKFNLWELIKKIFKIIYYFYMINDIDRRIKCTGFLWFLYPVTEASSGLKETMTPGNPMNFSKRNRASKKNTV